ncbi:hypothetical protein QBC38DRAFT_479677 [Podospora fimiseda]|uniref:GPI anchored protein n=1 Tax=Podospora fimiseda TaxID=252190 RepID=A0AAN7BNW4_9PEZI|nr:hypothetical protein QBC38DRAFT_479677 [Podospora fimiseda]
MVRVSTLLFAASLAAAQTSTVVTLFIPLAGDTQTIVGSVIAANPTATTYSIGCPPGTDSNDCGWATGVKVINGPKTAALDVSGEDSYGSAKFGCDLAPETVVCSGKIDRVTTTEEWKNTIPSNELSEFWTPITITAGLEKLAAGATGTGVSGFTTVTSTGSAGGAKETGKEESASTSTSTGGMAMVTGMPGVVVGAAALVGAMMI